MMLFCALWVFLGISQATTVSAQEEAESAGDYRIGAGDVLRIVVWRNEQLTSSVAVRPDGWISLPLLDDVRVAGRTPMELKQLLTATLRDFVSNPVVSVIVTDVRSFKVSVLGEVKSPGRFQLEGSATVLDVIAMAGGFVEFSSRDDVYLLRPGAGSYERFRVKFSDVTKPDGQSVNVAVKPGDIIVVP